ncbi:hypothetical protein IH601_07065 [Candidatus Bipolaricaulota bacterium]|nr:hypothetical protein [Candidatus Bipolaricaulota bacterium]TFH08892.1 MAG: hypothetical protein E4H08_06890 [Candidatus Atribacteria bacterium]
MSYTGRSTAAVLLVLVGIAIGYGSAGAFDVQELAPITDSFCQLAMWDAAAAGEVWMSDQAAQTWNRFIDAALPNETAMISLFTHSILLGDVTDDGTPIAGVFNPWTGTLIIMAFSETATSIETVATESLGQSLTETTDATQAALDIMAAIAKAGDRLDVYLTQPWDSVASEADWPTIADRLVTRSAQLRLVYPAGDIADPVLALAQDTLGEVQSGMLTDLLTVIEDADPQWVRSLLPVYASKTADDMVLALGSSLEPLHLVWVHITGDVIQDVSWIRLFNRVVTQTRGDS